MQALRQHFCPQHAAGAAAAGQPLGAGGAAGEPAAAGKGKAAPKGKGKGKGKGGAPPPPPPPPPAVVSRCVAAYSCSPHGSSLLQL